jgi:hypothetical protein
MAAPRSGIKKIVVGVDGSEHSEAAIDWAVRMARGMGSEVSAVFAISPPVYFDIGSMGGGTLAKCDPFGTPSTSHWTGAAIIVQSPRTKTCIVTRSRTSTRPMPFSLAG